jgi:hypothetical protein
MFENVRADFAAHRRLGRPGLLGDARVLLGVLPASLRKPRSVLYKIVFKLVVQALTGLELFREAVVKPRPALDGAAVKQGASSIAYGVVAIGRNEGERLKCCLQSAAGVGTLVYVDSGSDDGSVAWARARGIDVVELDVVGAAPERMCVWESRRAWIWGIWMPLACPAAVAYFGAPGLALLLVYPLAAAAPDPASARQLAGPSRICILRTAWTVCGGRRPAEVCDGSPVQQPEPDHRIQVKPIPSSRNETPCKVLPAAPVRRGLAGDRRLRRGPSLSQVQASAVKTPSGTHMDTQISRLMSQARVVAQEGHVFRQPSRQLLKTIRKYQSCAKRAGVLSRLCKRLYVLEHRFCCLLFQQMMIESRRRRREVPVLEGHVDVGAGAKILGLITIPAHSEVSANAVVTSWSPDRPQTRAPRCTGCRSDLAICRGYRTSLFILPSPDAELVHWDNRLPSIPHRHGISGNDKPPPIAEPKAVR